MKRTMRENVLVVVAGLFMAAIPMGGLWAAEGAPEKEASLLSKTWEAHGGVARWQAQKQMTYTLYDFPLSAQVAKPNTSTVDLRNRYNRIDGQGFTVGFDGKEAWAVPGPDAVGLPPRLFVLGSFYFIGMPFVFADPGVQLSDGGTARFRGKAYKVVNVGYGSGIGLTSKDDYALYIDPKTNRLALINHSVTEPAMPIKRVTWVFDEWQSVSGILVPKRLTFYQEWNDGKLTTKGKTAIVEKISFSAQQPAGTLYARPADGIIDASPLYE